MHIISVPSGAPLDIKGIATDSTSLEISWNPPPLEHQNGFIKHYTLKYREKGQRAKFVTVDGSKKSFVLHRLKKFTAYNVWVSASTKMGEGPYSERKTFTTAEDGERIYRTSVMRIDREGRRTSRLTGRERERERERERVRVRETETETETERKEDNQN